MKNTFVIDNPMVVDRLTLLRMKETGTRKFRSIVKEISAFLAYEAAKELPMREVTIETPLCETTQKRLDVRDIAVVPILRAGIGMAGGFEEVYPDAVVLPIGIERDEKTKEPTEYYCKIPENISRYHCVIVDPMLATGGSIIYTIKLLMEAGARTPVVACILAAPEGIERVHAAFPDVHIYCCAVDSHLDDNKYIVPGLGDAGDRIFGTL